MSKKYFLGSVGRAEAFRKNANGSLELAFVSKTLTTSGLTISTTKDDIRAGEGAPIQFSFYHDPSVEINLTDVVFKKEYIEAQLGASFVQGSGVSYQTAVVTFNDSGEGTLGTSDPQVEEIPFPCTVTNKRIAWIAQQGTDDWQIATAEVDNSGNYKKLTASGTTPAADYCVRYLGSNTSAYIAEVTSTIIPQELFLVITAPIFAGDSCAASKGKAAGYIQFEVPRFSLNGSQEFSMEMSSNQTMSLAGVALATESTDCETGAGKLLRIIEVVTDRQYFEDVVDLLFDEENLKNNTKPEIYGELKNGGLIRMDNNDIIYRSSSSGSYTRMNDDYKWATGTLYVNIAKSRTGTIAAFLGADEDVTIS